MSVSALDIVSAMQVIRQAAITADQVNSLLAKEVLTEADVLEVLNQTDATIERLKADD